MNQQIWKSISQFFSSELKYESIFVYNLTTITMNHLNYLSKYELLS